MNHRLARIASERERLQRDIAAGRGRIGDALRSSGRDAVAAVVVAGASRWLTRRFRWGPLAALAIGFAASKFRTRRPG